MATFDYQGALDAGYSDQEITDYLKNKGKESYELPKESDTFTQKIGKNTRNFFGNLFNPSGQPTIINKPEPEKPRKTADNFDYQGALDAGYSEEEIDEFLEARKPKRSYLEQAGRLGSQVALGAAEGALLPYEIAVTPLASKDAQNIAYREILGDDLEDLMTKKAAGRWDEKDQAQYESISRQLQDPEESGKFAQTADLGVRSLTEKLTGVDLKPEGFAEKAANWMGFLKDPSKLANLKKTGLSPYNLVKSIAPSGSDVLRGLGAGTALQIAENGDYGPIGTMGAAIVGDLLGGGTAATLKGTKNLVLRPKETLANIASKFTPKDKLKLQKNIINEFREAGIQADLGTITDSNVIKMTQSRLAQSGLSGKAYEDLMKQTTRQIESDYKNIADQLGELKYSSNFDAGLAAKEGMKSIREADLAASRRLYKEADSVLKEGAKVNTKSILSSIAMLEKNLTPGMIKSTEQSKVLDVIKNLKTDLVGKPGDFSAKVKALMNNKIALNDIINYEVQGGAKQLLKNIVGEIDRAIISHGKENPVFGKTYVNANKKFSDHAKTFRSRDMLNLLKDGDPAQLLNKMNTVNGIKNIEKVLSKSPEGKQIFNNLKRFKLDQTVGNNLIDSTTQQAKLGTFSKLLEKGKNSEVIKEILGPSAFKRLERLQRNSGRLADAVQKYYNASKTMASATDAAIVVQGMNSVGHLLMGNPWPFVKVSGGVIGGRAFNNLLSNPEFLKLVEEAILASETSSKEQMVNAFEKLRPYILQSLEKSGE